MTSRSISASRSATAKTYRMLKFTFSMQVTSAWTELTIRSPHWSENLSALQVQGFYHGGLNKKVV